jgi:molybdate-binding protein
VEVDSHFQVGLSVLGGSCDAGFGIRQVADTLGLGHVALYRERICMVVSKERYYGADVRGFLEGVERGL